MYEGLLFPSLKASWIGKSTERAARTCKVRQRSLGHQAEGQFGVTGDKGASRIQGKLELDSLRLLYFPVYFEIFLNRPDQHRFKGNPSTPWSAQDLDATRLRKEAEREDPG